MTAPVVRKTAVLLIILASYLMIVLDISIVVTALPKIHEGLAFSPTELSWVERAYTLAFGGLLVLGARGPLQSRELSIALVQRRRVDDGVDERRAHEDGPSRRD